jgi:hypothetical protein
MRTLADEIVTTLPAMIAEAPLGATVPMIVERFAVDKASARRAMLALDRDGRAIMVRRKGGRTHYLVPADYPLLSCRNCHAEFARPKKSKRVCCSRSCGIAWSWQNPVTREHRVAAIKCQRATPEGRANSIERNRRRWADPKQRENLSEQNRRRWADPITKAELSASIAKVNGSPEVRRRQSETRRAAWQDEAIRSRMEAGIRRSKSTPEARAKFSALLKERWRDPVWRAKWTAANRRRNEARAGKKPCRVDGAST